jgi:signal transduction histidine kinase
LRTPLNAVLGFAQLLALDRAPALSAAQQARVGHIQNAGWYLLSLINDVLELTRLETHESPPLAQAVQLLPVLHDCVQSLTLAGGAVAPVIDSSVSAALTVRADPARLKQALLNLINRAVQHQPAAGPVTLTAGLAAAESDVAGADSPTAPAAISLIVRDSSKPLTATQLQQLFEPFGRGAYDSGGPDAVGIGLTLSKLIIEQMGGRLAARVAPDATGQLGNEFALSLPAA